MIPNPSNVGSEQLTIQLPSACEGGKNKSKCVVSLKTAGGFGNCVVVQNPPKKREDGAVVRIPLFPLLRTVRS